MHRKVILWMALFSALLFTMIIMPTSNSWGAVVCGDANNDSSVDVSDLVIIVNYIFKDGPAPIPDLCVADFDGTLGADVADLVYMVNYIFKDGLPPLTECCPNCFSGETQPCYTGDPATRGVGECTDGIQDCVEGDWGPCTGEVLPVSEVCDYTDNDCNGVIDDNATDAITWYHDIDQDGYGDPGIFIQSCIFVPGYVTDNTDCNDADATINPGADEYCNGIDDNCNTTVDDNPVDGSIWYADADQDGFGNPSSSISACSQPGGYISDNSDCNDANPTIHPGADEYCNGLDDDCNTIVDDNPLDGSIWYRDIDHDGYGDPAETIVACSQPDGFVSDNTDCNDGNPTVHPGAAEYCNGIDDNCNFVTDENPVDGSFWYYDSDQDGFGNPQSYVFACSPPGGYVSNNLDCNDADASIHPGATEECNGVDDNCTGGVDEYPASVMCPPPPHVNSTACNGSSGCAISTCDYGYADCDGVYSNGCEVLLNNGANCGSINVNLGTMCGDDCGTTDRSYSSRGEKVMRIFFDECCTGLFTNDNFNVRFTLTSPSGTNYNLFVYEDNCSLSGSSTSGGTTDIVVEHWNDVFGFDDSKYMRIEVRYAGGSSCANWNLQIHSWATQPNPVPDDGSEDKTIDESNDSEDGSN